MAIIFDGNNTKNSPEAFPGVTLKSYIHPLPEYNDGYDSNKHGIPDVRFSFGLFKIDVGAEWPATRFDLAEVSYCLVGEGIFICDGIEHVFKSGSVIYIPKGETRVIKNTSDIPLEYLCIVDPAWLPKYELVLSNSN